MSETNHNEPVPRRKLGRELVLVVFVAMAVLAPGIWSYSLVDPWETHYGEVARNMLVDNDFVQTKWPGTNFENAQNEGFRSKPVLSFWMMAAGMRAVGVGEGGGYSGEMTDSVRVMIGIRLPFVLAAICGLTLLWWMLARLVSRRLAWLALLVVGSTPFFCLVSRQAIPDMPMVACVIGALSLFLLAVEDGDRPVSRFGGWLLFDARQVVLGIACGFVLLQAVYFAVFFATSPKLAVGQPVIPPAIWLPLSMLLLLAGLSRNGWLIVRLPFVAIGGVIGGIVGEGVPRRAPEQSRWRYAFDVVAAWERHSIDRYVVRAAALPFTWSWKRTNQIAEHVIGMKPITTMRQLYMLGCYFLLGVGLLAKGPPGFVVVAGVGFFYVVAFNKWRALLEGAFEIKRGLLLVVVVALPWHIAMFLKEGRRFIDEYFYQHILNRAGDGSVDKSLGSFEYYVSQIGHGMWLWAALLPAALGAAFVRSSRETREGRIRFVITLWAMVGVALFCLIQTKFHHYILPAIPPLALLVAFFLDDLLAKRERLHPLYAALAVGIVLLVCRDLMFEPERWIEMFIFRYDRAWPNSEPHSVDTSDAFLGLAVVAVVAITVVSTRFRRIGVALLGVAGIAIAAWALHIYMPIAGTHWGMRDAARTYYDERTIYGEKVVYFGDAQLADEWKDADDTRSIKTLVPTNIQIGQPMTVTVQLNKAEDERVMEHEIVMIGSATAVGEHSIEVTLGKGERAKLDELVDRGSRSNKRGRPPVRAVDADRLIAWQLYWRGEQFWSGGEIWAWLPEMKTSFPSTTSNVEFLKYINDQNRAPVGRRYFVLGDAGRINAVRALLPTQRAKDSFEVIDRTSNKFSLAWFEM